MFRFFIVFRYNVLPAFWGGKTLVKHLLPFCPFLPNFDLGKIFAPSPQNSRKTKGIARIPCDSLHFPCDPLGAWREMEGAAVFMGDAGIFVVWCGKT
jgi:hypothetical protein